MKHAILIVSSIFSASAFAYKNEVTGELPTAKPVTFEKVYIERQVYDSELNEVKIFGQVTYSNDCMAKDRKFKKVIKGQETIAYSVYGVHEVDDKVCAKIYMPVTKTVLIDTLFIPTEHSPDITVNQSLVD